MGERRNKYLAVDEAETIACSGGEGRERSLQCRVDEDLKITREVADDDVATSDGGERHLGSLHLCARSQSGDAGRPNAQLLRLSIVHANRQHAKHSQQQVADWGNHPRPVEMLRYGTNNLTVKKEMNRDKTTQQLGAKKENHQEGDRDQPDHKQKRANDVLHQNIANSLATGVERDERIQTRFLVIPCAERFLRRNTSDAFQQP